MDSAKSKSKFLNSLEKGILVLDGAMGSQLYQRGVHISRCFDELNLSQPDMILKIHNSYLNAGADILETNTFGANKVKLARHGLEAKLEDILRAGVKIAREAADSKPGTYVAGCIGPLGADSDSGKRPYADAFENFRTVAEILIDAGADLLLLETFTDSGELLEAVRAACEVASSRIPVIASAVYNMEGITQDGCILEDLVKEFEKYDLAAVGLNCRLGADMMHPLVDRMQKVTERPLICQPNVGKARVIEDRDFQLSTPEHMAEHMRRMLSGGRLKMVGGCCGSTPEHIRSITAVVRMLRPGRVSVVAEHLDTDELEANAPIADRPWSEKTSFARKIAAGKFVSSVEIRAPKGIDDTKIRQAVIGLDKGGVDAMNIPDGPRASARMHPLAIATMLRKEVKDIELIIHYTCRDRNLLGIQADLLGAHKLGQRNILAVTGDPPKLGDYPDATAVFDVDAIGLVSILKRLNRGLDLGGHKLEGSTEFLIGVGANPGALNLDEEVRRLERKIEAGAEYIFTQPVYDQDLLHNFLDRVHPLPVPILAGLYPLYSHKNAEFLHNEVPGMQIPDPIRERMKKAGSGPEAQETGVQIAREALESVKGMVNGAYIMPPFDKWQLALKVLDGFIEKK